MRLHIWYVPIGWPSAKLLENWHKKMNIGFWNQTGVKLITHDHFLTLLFNLITSSIMDFLEFSMINTVWAVDQFKIPQIIGSRFSSPFYTSWWALSIYAPMVYLQYTILWHSLLLRCFIMSTSAPHLYLICTPQLIEA